MRNTTLLWVAALAVALPASAQEGADMATRLKRAADLPHAAQEARQAGIPEEAVDEALEAGKKKGVPAGEMGETLAAGSEGVREHGPIDNFGAFVTAKLDEGLRGHALAEAIREEHAQRGKGKPEHAGPPEGKGKPDEAGPPEGKGKPDEAGPPAGRGGPDAAGPPMGKGKGKRDASDDAHEEDDAEEGAEPGGAGQGGSTMKRPR
jgi:hypothetical protein